MISQREAIRLRAQNRRQSGRINDLENEVRSIRGLNPFQGKVIVDYQGSDALTWSIRTANRLGHIVLVVEIDSRLYFRAMPLPSEIV